MNAENAEPFYFANVRGVAATAGISELRAEAALTLFKRRGRWIDLRDPAVRLYLEKQRSRRIESTTFARFSSFATRSALRTLI